MFFEQVHKDGENFGFVSDHGQAGRFRAYAYADEVGLAHYAGEHTDDANAAAAVMKIAVIRSVQGKHPVWLSPSGFHPRGCCSLRRHSALCM